VNTVGYRNMIKHLFPHVADVFWCLWSIPLRPCCKKVCGGRSDPKLTSNFIFLLNVTCYSPVKNCVANCLVAANQGQEGKTEI